MKKLLIALIFLSSCSYAMHNSTGFTRSVTVPTSENFFEHPQSMKTYLVTGLPVAMMTSALGFDTFFSVSAGTIIGTCAVVIRHKYFSDSRE